MAKSLGGGFPISAVVGRVDVMDAPNPGGLGGTYAGNPIAVAAAHAVIDVIESEGLCDRANELGTELVAVLNTIKAKYEIAALQLQNIESLKLLKEKEGVEAKLSK